MLPVDPYDVIRGRYVALSPMRQTLVIPEEQDFKQDETTYAVLEPGEDSFARVVDLSNKLVPGKVNLRVEVSARVRTEISETEGDEYSVNFPFARYYMNEKLALVVEELFSALSSKGRCSAVVKIYGDGSFAVADLEIDGLPIREFIEIEQKTQEEREWAEQEEE